jgi:hypothetical protein
MEKRMNEEEKRKYDREAKQRSRAKQRAEHMRNMIPLARNYVMPDEQETKLAEYALNVTKRVRADLGMEKISEQDSYIVDAVACVLLGLENNFTQIVHAPFGMVVGGWFPDAAASEAIEHVHRFPSLLQSTTFADLYRNFLHAVVKWSKQHEHYSTPEFIQEVQAEIGGTYVLPPLPELPKAEPKKIQEAPSVPSDPEILERGRMQLSNQLSVQDPNLSPDARRFLDGTL